ncbi:MAG: S9 family peptidase [Bacteroidota bacterium]
MKPLPSLFLIICLSFFVSRSISQTKIDSLTIEQALSKYAVKNPVFSPDGKKAVVVVSQTGVDKDLPASHIWLIDVATKTIRQFSNSKKSETNPKWSPDGNQLAFLSNRNEVNQIFLMDLNGGEAMQLTQAKSPITAFEWNPISNTIAYLAEEPASAEEEKRKADQYDEQAISESAKPTRVFIIDVNTKLVKQFTHQNWEVEEMKWMPSGDALLLITQTLPLAEIPVYQLNSLSLIDSSVVNISSPTHSFWGNIQISPDGNMIAYNASRGDGPDADELFLQSLKTGVAKNITAKSIDLPIRTFKFIDNNHLVAVVQKGFSTNLFSINDNGNATEYPIDQNIGSFDVAANGTILFESFSATKPSDVWLMGADKKPMQVSHFNKVFEGIALAKPKFITYKSFDGLPIEAALYKPAISSSKLLPLVVFIHGGPTSAFINDYSAWVQLFVQQGYAVFCPNIRGSTGYGQDFLIANRNDWGGNDFKDIMYGVDMLIAKEKIDSNRMGISGWSYGGYMAEWAITQTNRFKAAMAGAGIANLASEFGTEDNAAYDHWFFGTPYEHPDNFSKHAPISFIKNAKTPTLIIQGENDKIDPVGQSQELYRALRYYNVPTELVLYPNEPHGFKQIKHNIDFYKRMINWFDKYVLSN